jgi:hypothetical protein
MCYTQRRGAYNRDLFKEQLKFSVSRPRRKWHACTQTEICSGTLAVLKTDENIVMAKKRQWLRAWGRHVTDNTMDISNSNGLTKENQ